MYRRVIHFMIYVLHMLFAYVPLFLKKTKNIVFSTHSCPASFFFIDTIFNGPIICWTRVGRRAVCVWDAVCILGDLFFLFPWGTVLAQFQHSSGLCSSQQSHLYHHLRCALMVSISPPFSPLFFFFFFTSGSQSWPEDQNADSIYFPCVIPIFKQSSKETTLAFPRANANYLEFLALIKILYRAFRFPNGGLKPVTQA